MRYYTFFRGLFLAWIAALALGASGCATLRAPDSFMHPLGAQAYREQKARHPAALESRDAEVVQRVSKRIATASGESFDWEVTLFEAPSTVNAFCLPGGKIGVYTGILPVALNEAGLATVIAHEVGHAVARHGAQRVVQQLGVRILLISAAILLRNNEYRDILLRLIGIGTELGLSLPYGREHEFEADRLGLEYMARAGYDPQEAVMLWKRMAATGNHLPEIISTHPDPLSRAKALAASLPKVIPLYEQSQKQASALIPSQEAAVAAHVGRPGTSPVGAASAPTPRVGGPPPKKPQPPPKYHKKATGRSSRGPGP